MMRTTLNQNRVPRILVRIQHEDRLALTEKEIKTSAGQSVKFYLASAEEKVRDKTELTVRIGRVMGMSEGVGGVKKGDIAILDYTVDVDDEYFVTWDGKDKIVSVPCLTTLCRGELVATSYDEKFIERNVIVQKTGDVDQLSLVLGLIRGTQFIPNDHYVFCEYEPEQPPTSSLIMFNQVVPTHTHIERTIAFVGKQSKLKEGQRILAMKDSNMTLTLANNTFEIIPVTDILATIEVRTKAA